MQNVLSMKFLHFPRDNNIYIEKDQLGFHLILSVDVQKPRTESVRGSLVCGSNPFFPITLCNFFRKRAVSTSNRIKTRIFVPIRIQLNRPPLFDRSFELNARQIGAIRKRTACNPLYAVGNHNACQIRASLKHQVRNTRHTAGNNDLLQILSILKAAGKHNRHALGNRIRAVRFIDGIVKQFRFLFVEQNTVLCAKKRVVFMDGNIP